MHLILRFVDALRTWTWHRKCYKSTTNKVKIERAAKRYKRNISGQDQAVQSTSTCTRPTLQQYNTNICIFCDEVESKNNPLHRVVTLAAGNNLKVAAELSKNNKLLVRINASPNPSDAHAMDVLYHKKCWLKNVTNVIKSNRRSNVQNIADRERRIATAISFLEGGLMDGKVLGMEIVESWFANIASKNGLEDARMCRKKLKQMILIEIPDVEFCKPKRVNEAERILIKKTSDAAISQAESSGGQPEASKRAIFEAAKLLRKSVLQCNQWEFCGSLTDLTSDHLPTNLILFSNGLSVGCIHQQMIRNLQLLMRKSIPCHRMPHMLVLLKDNSQIKILLLSMINMNFRNN